MRARMLGVFKAHLLETAERPTSLGGGAPVRVAADSAGIALAARIARAGGIIAYPTDTVYGLGCDPRNPMSVGRVLRLKGRSQKPMPVLVANVIMAERLVRLGPSGRRLARKFWPGAVTLVAPLHTRGLAKALLGSERRLGVRVPGLQVTRRLLQACNGVLVGTSANRAGAPAPRDPDHVLASLPAGYEVLLDGGRTPLGCESTVVDVTTHPVRVLREGCIPAAQVFATLAGEG